MLLLSHPAKTEQARYASRDGLWLVRTVAKTQLEKMIGLIGEFQCSAQSDLTFEELAPL